MKRYLLWLAFPAVFLLGYGFRDMTHTEKLGPRATSIGGVFFRAKDPKALKQWYADYLGMRMVESGTNFEWYQGQIVPKKDLHFGRLLRKLPNILVPWTSNS